MASQRVKDCTDGDVSLLSKYTGARDKHWFINNVTGEMWESAYHSLVARGLKGGAKRYTQETAEKAILEGTFGIISLESKYTRARDKHLFHNKETNDWWEAQFDAVRRGCSVGPCRGWGRDGWLKKASMLNEDGLSYLYLLKATERENPYLKVGITSRRLKDRYCQYSCEISEVRTWRLRPEVCWDLERMVIRDFKGFQPREWRLLKFIGKTECFTWTEELEQAVINFININKFHLCLESLH